MKKIISLMMLAVAVITLASCNKEKKQPSKELFNTSVEELIKTDETYFQNMAGKVALYESRIVMPKAFNESDFFIAQSVTNVFQQTIEKGDGFETTVYLFTHTLNTTDTDISIHKGAFILDDKPLQMDSIKVSFDEAFKHAKMSNYIPSRSRYITLRRAVSPMTDKPYYVIGNDNYGLMLVDAIDGTVTDKLK